ncbi:MAG: TonB-dependent siderophore receptor [Verrucomicrobium sp.]
MNSKKRTLASAHLLLFLGALAPIGVSLAEVPVNPTAELPPVTVTAPREPALYGSPSATTALKSAVPLLETPQAVTVLSQALIKDRGYTKLEDVLRNSAGVSPSGWNNSVDTFRIRGYNADDVTYLDGLKVTGYSGTMELWGLDRVEVLKGPSSTLYGGSSLGGLVNLVSKKPSATPGGELMIGGGSFDMFEAGLDWNAPLFTPPALSDGKGGTLSPPPEEGVYARLNAYYKNGGGFTDYNDYERIYVAPSIAWHWGPDTSLVLLATYKYTNEVFQHPFPAQGSVSSTPYGKIPVDRFIGFPGESQGVESWYASIGYEFRHAFSEAVSFRQNARASWSDAMRHDVLTPAYLDPDQRTLYLLSPLNVSDEYFNFAVDTAVDLKFATGSIKHLLTLGVDVNYAERDQAYNADFIDLPLIPFDLYRPNYNYPFSRSHSPLINTPSEFTQVGLYVQDHVNLTEALALTLGGRYDFTSFDGYDDEVLTPRVGLTYEITPGVALYASYSRSFNPQWNSIDTQGNPVDPEEGENWEAGIKTALLGGRINTTLSVFQLTRENPASDDFSTPEPWDAVTTGEQRSRGVELEGALRLAPGWDLIAAYAYTDARVTEDENLPVGARLPGVPKHSFSGWMKYTLQDGPLKGFGAGLGGRYLTRQAGDLFNTFDLPSYGVVDAALFYEGKDFRVQVNFNNILDKQYYVGSYDALLVQPGRPFNVSASVTWKF